MSFHIRKPDGTPATAADIAAALAATTRAKEHEMDCPTDGCDGRVEAFCSIWFTVGANSVPFVSGIGWFEGGKFECSKGGAEHIPVELVKRLDTTMRQYCQALEERIGAETGDTTRPGDVVWTEAS